MTAFWCLQVNGDHSPGSSPPAVRPGRRRACSRRRWARNPSGARRSPPARLAHVPGARPRRGAPPGGLRSAPGPAEPGPAGRGLASRAWRGDGGPCRHGGGERRAGPAPRESPAATTSLRPWRAARALPRCAAPPPRAVALGLPSPVSPPVLWRHTRGCAGVAGRAPCPRCPAVAPARDAPRADAQASGRGARGGPARPAWCGSPPQPGWPRLAAAWAPAAVCPARAGGTTRRGRPPAGAWRAGAAGATPRPPLTGGHALPPASPPRLPRGAPAGSLALAGTRRADPVPHADQGGGRRRLAACLGRGLVAAHQGISWLSPA